MDLAGKRVLRFGGPKRGVDPSFLAGGGDINNDGHKDVVVASSVFSYNGRKNSGAAWVVFGPFKRERINVADLHDRGFPIYGAQETDYTGIDIAGLGDVNGDGLDDVLVGAPYAHNIRNDQSGVAYVVFGKKTMTPIDLLDFQLGIQDKQGFRIDGAYNRSHIGEFLDDTGDVNRDGLNDMILGSVFGRSAYVVFGKEDTLPVDLLSFELSDQGDQGFRIDTPSPADNSDETYGVAGIGDINGDHKPDLWVDVCPTFGDFGCRHSKGWAIFGKAGSRAINVHDLGKGGFAIRGAAQGSGLGVRPGRGGDVNGDGRDDLVVLEGEYAVDAWIVFGKKSVQPLSLSNLRSHGYRIEGSSNTAADEPSYMRHLYATSAAGDVNRDGTPDSLIGTPYAGTSEKDLSGVVYVVYGQEHRQRTIRLGNLGTNGYRVSGPAQNSDVGRSIQGVGRLGRDDVPDFLIKCDGERTGVIGVWGSKF